MVSWSESFRERTAERIADKWSEGTSDMKSRGSMVERDSEWGAALRCDPLL